MSCDGWHPERSIQFQVTSGAVTVLNIAVLWADPITCRSSPVLFRLGLTGLVRKLECLEKGRYYMLTLSAAGYEAIRENANRSD
jgi:hypothetical protein